MQHNLVITKTVYIKQQEDQLSLLFIWPHIILKVILHGYLMRNTAIYVTIS